MPAGGGDDGHEAGAQELSRPLIAPIDDDAQRHAVFIAAAQLVQRGGPALCERFRVGRREALRRAETVGQQTLPAHSEAVRAMSPP